MAEETVLQLVAAVEKQSQHPLAKAILTTLHDKGLTELVPTDFQSVTGKGAYATVDGQKISVGSLKWIATLTTVDEMTKNEQINCKHKVKRLSRLVSDDQLIGIIGIADQLREESKHVSAKATCIKSEAYRDVNRGREANC